MLAAARNLLELVRFSHTVFALPFALLSAALAWRDEPFRGPDLAGVLLCMVFARSAAMAFNRLVDRRLDADNPRTVGRHLPAGLLSVAAVRAFTAACSFAFVASTLLFLPNRWPLFLSVPVLLFLLGCLLYAGSLGHEWALDDTAVYTENPAVQDGLSGVRRILTSDAYAHLYEQMDRPAELSGGRYRPLSLITFALDE